MGSENGQGGRIPKELAEVFAQLCAKTCCEDWVLTGRPKQRLNCRIYFLKSGSFRLPGLALKIFRKNSVERWLAEEIHSQSLVLHKASTPECTVPEPVFLLQDENAMAMEFVTAPAAWSLWLKGFHSKDRRHAIIRKAATWLGWFHGNSLMAVEPIDASPYTARLANLRAKISSRRPKEFRSDGLLRECLDLAEKVALELEGIMIPHATAHRDFTLFNMFIDGGTTIGYDYRGKHRLPVYYDICYFLVVLDRLSIMRASAGDIRQYGCRKEDFDVFMHAYGKGNVAVDERLWLKLMFIEITLRIAVHTLSRARTKRILRFFAISHQRRNARLILNTLR